LKEYQKYSAVDSLVNEDDKPKILLKVYQTIIDKHEIVKSAISQGDYKRKFEELSKITTVLEFLNVSLDMSYGEIPKNLSSLYRYLIRRLHEVHTTLDIETIEECKEIIRKMLDGFSAAYENEKKKDKKTITRNKEISI
jgi:flagellar protein FliS